MACPKCECKTTYAYYEDDMDSDTDMERCARCGNIFYLDEALDEDDEPEYLEIPSFLRRGTD
jgi:hypothetical protein